VLTASTGDGTVSSEYARQQHISDIISRFVCANSLSELDVADAAGWSHVHVKKPENSPIRPDLNKLIRTVKFDTARS
jgi:hypothetical protein